MKNLLIGILCGLVVVANAQLNTKRVLATDGVDRVLTYDQALDSSDQGSNPGLEIYRVSFANDAMVGHLLSNIPSQQPGFTVGSRLQRSNDNNGQWDYDPVGAYFEGGTFVVFGTRTGSHGPQPRVWKSATGGSFLVQSTPNTTKLMDDGNGGLMGLVGDFSISIGSNPFPEFSVNKISDIVRTDDFVQKASALFSYRVDADNFVFEIDGNLFLMAEVDPITNAVLNDWRPIYFTTRNAVAEQKPAGQGGGPTGRFLLVQNRGF